MTNTYGYDEADRLTSWTATPSGGTATTQTYGYDNDGNMTSDNGVTYTYDARDELVSSSNGTSYAYTADGDLQSAGSDPLRVRRLRAADHRRRPPATPGMRSTGW